MSKIIIKNSILLFCMIHFVLSTTQDDKWLEYKKTYNKKYASTEEESNHKKNFFDNLRKIEEHNKRFKEGKETFERNISEFTDMNLKEVIQKRTFSIKKDASFLKVPIRNITLRGPLPDKVNWVERGFKQPIQNQGDCGSCYAFATVAALEAHYFIKNKTLIKLSEQYAMDCTSQVGNNGCGGGKLQLVYKYTKLEGIALNEGFPYLERKTSCRKNYGGKVLRISSYNRVHNEEELKKVVATIGPVSVAVHVVGNFIDFKSDKVYYNPECKSDYYNHFVLVVGYGTTPQGEDYWLIRNSYGSDWGDNGYMKLARNKGSHCAIGTFGLYPINPKLIYC